MFITMKVIIISLINIFVIIVTGSIFFFKLVITMERASNHSTCVRRMDEGGVVVRGMADFFI